MSSRITGIAVNVDNIAAPEIVAVAWRNLKILAVVSYRIHLVSLVVEVIQNSWAPLSHYNFPFYNKLICGTFFVVAVMMPACRGSNFVRFCGQRVA